MTTTEIKPKVKAPSLKELRDSPCSLEELQAAMVKLIDLHNLLANKKDVRSMVFDL